jgi:ABC-type dipeptide/oligopeptide/nickel transport system permease component
MLVYLAKRLGRAVFTLILLMTTVFFALKLVPGDPVSVALGPGATPEVAQALRAKYGLDEPVLVQYLTFWKKLLLHGDLGISWSSGIEVTRNLVPAIKHTAILTSSAMLIASFIGILAGVGSATIRNRPEDVAIRSSALVGISLPVFILNLLGQYIFGYKLGWFPTSGAASVANLVLPAVTLGIFVASSMVRMVRASMLDVLSEEYITTYRAEGFGKGAITRKAFRNALRDISTIVGLQFGMLLGGAVLTETVFSWPGIGQYVVQAILWNDMPSVQGAVMFFAVSYMFINLLIDLSYPFIDPRVIRA